MRHKSIIQEITLTGLLVGLAVIVGYFAHFNTFGGNVYLIGTIVFLMPLALKYPFAIIGALTSIFIVDATTGYLSYTWISLIAYAAGVTVIYMFSLLKFKLIYILGLIIASLLIAAIYFFLETLVIDRAVAISDLWATLLQFAIVIPITSLLYLPFKLLTPKK